MKKFLLMLTSGIILCSCSSPKNLLKSLSNHRFSLDYPYNSEIIDCDQKVKIAIGAAKFDSFSALTNVSKVKRSAYPFIFINTFSEEFWINLGQSSLEESFSDFFVTSFFRESRRTGCYEIVDNPKDADYVVDFILKDVKTESVYKIHDLVIFLGCYYLTNHRESGSKANTSMEIQLRLIGESGRWEKTYMLEKEMPLYGNNYHDIDGLRYNFMENMAESLSITTQECIEMIIKDINLNILYKKAE
ncbi:MAG: hypothetical protein LBH32_03670 [Dysgonamonadaceae bacterium]|jgi:hypothetical protein|nr:hypothetical protein [Dysgonamonadaceae bacterium]